MGYIAEVGKFINDNDKFLSNRKNGEILSLNRYEFLNKSYFTGFVDKAFYIEDTLYITLIHPNAIANAQAVADEVMKKQIDEKLETDSVYMYDTENNCIAHSSPLNISINIDTIRSQFQQEILIVKDVKSTIIEGAVLDIFFKEGVDEKSMESLMIFILENQAFKIRINSIDAYSSNNEFLFGFNNLRK